MRHLILPFVFLLLVSISCRRDPLKVDISGVELDLQIERFEKYLFSIPPDSLEGSIGHLSEKYGNFLDRFSYVINIGQPGDLEYASYLKSFVADTMVRRVYRDVSQVFPNLENTEETVETAFRYYLYHFPGREIPQLYSYLSGYNHSLIIDRGILGVGLDKYLGKDYPYYAMLGLPGYMRQKMHPERLPIDMMYYWLSTEFPFHDSIDNVLSNMVYQGQLLYLTEAMFPGVPDSVIMGYSPEQTEWVEMNERDMYTYLVENRLLFDKSRLTVSKLVNDGPFTQFFSTESPGRTGAWLGWQIVRQYMREYPGTSLAELMSHTDYQSLFTESRYRP